MAKKKNKNLKRKLKRRTSKKTAEKAMAKKIKPAGTKNRNTKSRKKKKPAARRISKRVLLKKRLPDKTAKRVKKPRKARRKNLAPKKLRLAKRTGNSTGKKWPIFTLNSEFGSFYELRDLILKSLPAEKDRMVEKINKLGRVRLAVVSGIFINKESVDPFVADLLIVGDDIEARKLRSFLRALEAEVGKEIKFAVMDKEEFQYRLAMFDRFVRVLMEGPHEKLINRLGL